MIRSFTLALRRSHTDSKNLQSISSKPFFRHYQQGVSLSLDNQLQQANQQFEKSLYEIKNSKQTELEHFSYILRRIANNHRRLGQMREAQERLYEIIKEKRNNQVSPALLFDDYDLIYRHMLSYDLQKAIKLCKALLQHEKEDMPIIHAKKFAFNLANAYLLSGNYIDSKKRYSQLLESDPQGTLKAYILNNLALACWWHKNPLQKQNTQVQGKFEAIQRDFHQAKDLFGKSILISEQLNEQTQETKLMLKQILDFKKGSLHENYRFSSGASIFPIYNISQYYLSNDPSKKVQIIFWLKKSLQLAQKQKKKKIFNQIFAEYCLLTGDYETLKESLPSEIQQHRYSQQFIQQANLSMVLGMVLSKGSNQEKQKGESYIRRAAQIRSILPAWSWKLKNIALDDLNLI